MSTIQGSLPVRDAPLNAGGGQPSTTSEHQRVSRLSPNISAHLDQIYRSLASEPPHEASPDHDTIPLSSRDDFLAWFQSQASSALGQPAQHDLSFPLSSYYISSSHNTYLSGNQLYGSASTEAYTNVLIRGCRCLEIDVWNGEDDSSDSDLDEDAKVKKDHGRDHAKHSTSSRLTRFTSRVKSTAQHIRSSSSSPDKHDQGHHHLHNSDSVGARSLRHEPRVYHGYTLTKDVPFRTVCRAIKESAFTASTLPIIVSLEVHADLEQQQVMVEIMEEEWENHLVDISSRSQSQIETLPSPNELREKILIKVKWSPNAETGVSNNPLDHVQSDGASPTRESHPDFNPEKQKKASKILDALSRLGVYTRAYSFKHFDQPEAKLPNHVFSLSEDKIEALHSDPEHGSALFRHNRDYLMRIFPSGLRVDSSNIDPTFGWRQGAQMVALNWQKLDLGMMLNEGMFTGEEGWVLKPEGFRGTHVSSRMNPVRLHLDLNIELFAGQSLPLPFDKEISHLPKMKPYVKFQLHVDVHGPPGQDTSKYSDSTADLNSRYDRSKHRDPAEDFDEEARKLKRKSKTSKTSDPEYGGESMTWIGVPDVVDQLSFLRVKVQDDRAIGTDDLVAWACIRLDRLKTGFRFIHLLDAKGNPSQGVLLVKIAKRLR